MDILPAKFEGHNSAIYSLAFSLDNLLLASGDYEGEIRLWYLPTGQPQSILREASNYEYAVSALAFNPDGTILASADGAGLQLWDTTTSIERFAYKLSGVVSLAWKPGENILAYSTDVVTLCNGQTGEILRVLKGHPDWITALAWNPDGTLLATGSADEDGSIHIWDIETGKLVALLEDAYSKPAGIAFYSNDRLFFTKGYGTLFQWEIETGKTQKLFEPDHTMYETGLSGDGRLVAYGTTWEPSIFSHLYHMKLSVVAESREPIILHDDSDEIMGITFSPDNTKLAIADASDIIRVWDVHQLLSERAKD